MTIRRGLTLLEVLLATVLLAIIAATCAPMLQRSLAVLHANRLTEGVSDELEIPGVGAIPEVERVDLAELADALVDDPEAFGIDVRLLTTTTIAWSEHPYRPPIQLARLIQSSAEVESQGSWLVLSCDDWHIHRYLPPPPEAAPEGANGHPLGFNEGGAP